MSQARCNFNVGNELHAKVKDRAGNPRRISREFIKIFELGIKEYGKSNTLPNYSIENKGAKSVKLPKWVMDECLSIAQKNNRSASYVLVQICISAIKEEESRDMVTLVAHSEKG